MAEDPRKLDRYKSQMPEIPGVAAQPDSAADADTSGKAQSSGDLTARIAGPAIAIVVVVALGIWLFTRTPRPAPPVSSSTASPSPAVADPPAAAAPAAAAKPVSGIVVVASLEELAKPWSSKPFVFHQSLGDGAVEALAVRLPGPANRAASYWAFSLQQPFGKCRLEWVPDTDQLSSQYGFQASHPMVASPCDGTLYDPLKLGTTPKGAWARGEVVHGNGIRPPIEIELRLEGSQVIATRIEQ
jgi:hypothetical protein